MFGPDGYLYYGSGDGGDDDSNSSQAGNGQLTTNLLGKILRLDVSGMTGTRRYKIPADNPFAANPLCNVDGTGSANCPEIFAWGFRNPWRWSTSLNCGAAAGPFVAPVAEYEHPTGVAVTGGYVYHGKAIPGLAGRYVFGDYSSGWLWNIPTDTPPTRFLLPADGRDSNTNIASFAQDTDGELYIVDVRTSGIYKLIAGS